MANKLNIATKEDYASRPSVPSNKKESATEFNQVVSAVNANYDRLILDWGTDILVNTTLAVGQYVLFTDGLVYRIITAYNVGNPLTWNAANAVPIASGISRESSRADSTELLFDKNEINMQTIVQSGTIEISIATSGHLLGQNSVIDTEIQFDGVNPINFTGVDYFSNISHGEIIEAGTYQVFFYRNMIGKVTVSLVTPSLEANLLTPLSSPGSFAAVPDGDNAMDLSWADVANESGYEIQYSTVGSSGPWNSLTSPAAGATSYNHTGLAAGTTYYYRIRAVGDQVTFTYSNYATTAGTTTSSSDTTPPTVAFNPLNAATEIAVNQPMIITANEAIQKADGTTLMDANILDVIVAKVDNISGADIDTIGTIDASKKIVTITPDIIWPVNDNVFIQISAIEDINENEIAAAASATFGTNSYTLMNSNKLQFFSALDAYIVGEDKKFAIEFTFKGAPTVGLNTMMAKWNSSGNQRSCFLRSEDTDVVFKWYRDGTDLVNARAIRWANALPDSNEHTIRLEYDGTIDTNNGIDRGTLTVDGILQTSKTLEVNDQLGSLPPVFPFGIFAGSASTNFLRIAAQMKDLVFQADTGSGWVDVVDVPVIRTGEDVSGNNIDGTWG